MILSIRPVDLAIHQTTHFSDNHWRRLVSAKLRIKNDPQIDFIKFERKPSTKISLYTWQLNWMDTPEGEPAYLFVYDAHVEWRKEGSEPSGPNEGTAHFGNLLIRLKMKEKQPNPTFLNTGVRLTQPYQNAQRAFVPVSVKMDVGGMDRTVMYTINRAASAFYFLPPVDAIGTLNNPAPIFAHVRVHGEAFEAANWIHQIFNDAVADDEVGMGDVAHPPVIHVLDDDPEVISVD